MKAPNKNLWLLAVAFLTGCASPEIAIPTVSQAEIDATDIGKQPEHALDMVKELLELRLRDPGSAQYKDGWFKKSSLYVKGRNLIGWEYFVLINAKNGYGGYTGYQRWGFFFVNGRIFATQDGRNAGSKDWVIEL